MLRARQYRRTLPARVALLGSGVGLVCIAVTSCGGALSPSDDGSPDHAGADAGLMAIDASAADAAAHPADGGDGSDAARSVDGSDGAAPGRDAGSCGSCDGTCFGPRCLTVLARNQVLPSSIAVTSRRVYWTNAGRPDVHYDDGAVMAVDRDGGSPVRIASVPGAGEVVADEASVVWSDARSIFAWQDGGGGAPVVVADSVRPRFIAIDASGVYWTGDGSANGLTADLWRADRNGGNRARLGRGDGMPADILVHAGVVYWQAYATSYETTIYAVDTDGKNPRTLATGLGSGFFPWAVPSTDLYWGPTADPLEIVRMRLDGGARTVVATDFTPAAMTADETDVYFTNDNSVYELPTDGGKPVALAWRIASPRAIAVDGESLYFTDTGSCVGSACTGAILRLTPK